MSTIEKHANSLREMMERNRLVKHAEEVQHIGDPASAQGAYGDSHATAEVQGSPTGTVLAEGTVTNPNKIPDKEVPAAQTGAGGTDEDPKAGEVGMTVTKAPEQKTASERMRELLKKGSEMPQKTLVSQAVVDNARKILGNALAKRAAALNEELATATQGIELLHKAASSKAAADVEALRSHVDELHKNEVFEGIFRKLASAKFAEDVAALAGADASPEDQAAVAQALEDEMAANPAAAEELQGELEGQAMDELSGIEGEAAAVDEIAQELGISPEETVQAIGLIEEAAAENNMSVPQFVEALAQSIPAQDAPEGAPAEPAAELAAKEASAHLSPIARSLAARVI